MTTTTTTSRAGDAPASWGLSLPEAATRSGYGISTLRRHIKEGSLPAVKAKGRVYVKPQDLDAFTEPVAMYATSETLEAWAKRTAAKAPPFSPEQRSLILNAFASTLGGE